MYVCVRIFALSIQSTRVPGASVKIYYKHSKNNPFHGKLVLGQEVELTENSTDRYYTLEIAPFGPSTYLLPF